MLKVGDKVIILDKTIESSIVMTPYNLGDVDIISHKTYVRSFRLRKHNFWCFAPEDLELFDKQEMLNRRYLK